MCVILVITVFSDTQCDLATMTTEPNDSDNSVDGTNKRPDEQNDIREKVKSNNLLINHQAHDYILAFYAVPFHTIFRHHTPSVGGAPHTI